MRYIVCCTLALTAAVAGCGGGSSGGSSTTTQTTSAWQLDDPEYTPGDVSSLAIGSDGMTAYVTNGVSLLTFDVDAGQLNPRSHLTNRSAAIGAINDQGSELYLIQGSQSFPSTSSGVFAFDPATGAQTPLGNVTSGAAAAVYVNSFVYVAGLVSGVVDVVSTTGGQQSAINLPVGGSVYRTIARTPQGTSVLVGDFATLHVIDPVSRRLLYSIPSGIAASRILPTDEQHAVVLGPDSFETVDITDPGAVPDVHPYPFVDGLEMEAPALLVDGGRRLLIARRAPFGDSPNDPYPTFVQPELVVIDIATGTVRDRTLVLRQEPFAYDRVYRLAPTADPAAFVFTSDDEIYVLRRTAAF